MPMPTDHCANPAAARGMNRTVAARPQRLARGRLWTLALAGTLAALGAAGARAWVGEHDAGRLPPTTAAPARPAGRADRTEELAPARPPRLEVKSEPTPGVYILRVKVGGGRPDAVQVIPRGQALDLSLSTASSTANTAGSGVATEARPGAATGTSRRPSTYHGSVHRRVPLPADADLGRVTREISGDTLVLRVPRRAGPPSAHPAAPARPAGVR